jgi:hypothetical protein|nr:MAG TPA: hypothetical protein [Caudoviricetes sp.]
MLEAIEFKADRFKKGDNYNLIEFTKNTVILCSDYKLMDTLTKEIINTVNGKAEYNDYYCDDEDDGNAKLDLCFGLQRIIDINGQKITIGLEPAIIYKANKPEDIWLFAWQGCDEIETLPKYEEYIYPMLIFKGSRKTWEDGKDAVYQTICNGRYGCYHGKWIDLYGDHYDEKVHNCNGKYKLHIANK